MSNRDFLEEYIAQIKASNKSFFQEAEDKLKSLAMPEGGLGEVQEISKKLCSIQESLSPKINRPICLVSIADHGVMAQGVSKYPQITDAVAKTALHGGAAINAFCSANNCNLELIDFGLAKDLKNSKLIDAKVASGTADMSLGPAMTRDQCLEAIVNGIKIGEDFSKSHDCLVLGEIGLGNTTASAALFSALSHLEPSVTTGPGTGLQNEALKHKIAVIRKSLEVNQPNSEDPLDCLSKVGGFEIAGMVGLIIGFSKAQKTIMLDGYITGVAALLAQRLCPHINDYLFAGHQSAEPAHQLLLKELQLKPILKLEMRLGEGIGGVLALNTLRTSCEVLNSMMTLEEALSL